MNCICEMNFISNLPKSAEFIVSLVLERI